MRPWLDSLAGRMVLLLVAALLLAQLISFGIYLIDRRDLVASITEEVVVSRLPSAVRVLRQLEPEQRQGVLDALSSRWSAYRLDTEPVVAAAAALSPHTAQLADALSMPAGEDVRVALVSGRAAHDSTWHGIDSAQQLHIAIHLEGSTWLNSVRALPEAWHLAWRKLLPLALSALAVIAVAVYQARRIAHPLDKLARQAERFGRGESVERLPETGPADVARTVHAFNEMSERQRRFVQDRTRMLAAISHDLRTPVTAMKLRVEMLEDGAAREPLERSLDEMERMVESTLGFSRAEASEGETHEVDLHALVTDAAQQIDPEGAALRVEPDSGPELTYRCRPLALSRAVRNVLDNAVRYGGGATVSVHRYIQGVSIVVHDRGPGIAEDALEQVFAPFYRIETSRSVDTGGTGLGLAIVRSIVRGHGGEVVLVNGESGLKVEIQLPAAPGQ